MTLMNLLHDHYDQYKHELSGLGSKKWVAKGYKISSSLQESHMRCSPWTFGSLAPPPGWSLNVSKEKRFLVKFSPQLVILQWHT